MLFIIRLIWKLFYCADFLSETDRQISKISPFSATRIKTADLSPLFLHCNMPRSPKSPKTPNTEAAATAASALRWRSSNAVTTVNPAFVVPWLHGESHDESTQELMEADLSNQSTSTSAGSATSSSILFLSPFYDSFQADNDKSTIKTNDRRINSPQRLLSFAASPVKKTIGNNHGGTDLEKISMTKLLILSCFWLGTSCVTDLLLFEALPSQVG